MTSLAQINDTQVSIINFKSIPVVTTEMLADFYGTEPKNIQQNHTRNKDRFVEGKHFFRIVGQELKDFVTSLKLVTNDLFVNNIHTQNLQPSQRGVQISSKTRVLTLWTERGAARHAKMLDTDQAWEVFEQLEDCYFVRKEILAKTHKSERTALHDAHTLLITKTKHLSSSDAWKLIHQRFNVHHIDEIPYDTIPVAVEYVHHLIALYNNAEKFKQDPNFATHAHNTASHMLWVSAWWNCFSEAIKILNPKMAGCIDGNFADGSLSACLTLGEDRSSELNQHILKYLPYDLSPYERMAFFRHQ